MDRFLETDLDIFLETDQIKARTEVGRMASAHVCSVDFEEEVSLLDHICLVRRAINDHGADYQTLIIILENDTHATDRSIFIAHRRNWLVRDLPG